MAFNDSIFTGLNKAREFQQAPLGTTSALGQNTGFRRFQSNRNSMQNDYARATRLLRRASRRGDVDAAIKLPQVRAEANAQGFNPGGIRSYEQERETARNDYQSMQQEANRNTSAAARLTQATTPTAVAQTTPAIQPQTQAPAPGTTFTPSDATTNLGRFAARALDRNVTALQGFSPESRSEGNLEFRQGLDRALGQAQTEEEVSELRRAGAEAGVSEEAFNKRSKWWERNNRRNNR